MMDWPWVIACRESTTAKLNIIFVECYVLFFYLLSFLFSFSFFHRNWDIKKDDDKLTQQLTSYFYLTLIYYYFIIYIIKYYINWQG